MEIDEYEYQDDGVTTPRRLERERLTEPTLRSTYYPDATDKSFENFGDHSTRYAA
jgi:hypothetical protein